jgi:hypothetical protein
MEIELRLLAFGIHHVEQVEQNAERQVLKEPKLHVAATNVTACGNVRKDDQLTCGRSYCFPPLDTIPLVGWGARLWGWLRTRSKSPLPS